MQTTEYVFSALCTITLRSTQMPMHFIVMNFISKCKVSPKGHQYALTVTDMLANYTWHILQEANKLVHAYKASVYSMFSGSYQLLSDNDNEFKNMLLLRWE